MRLLQVVILTGLASAAAAAQSGETLASGTFVKNYQKIAGSYVIRKVGDTRTLELSADFKTKSGPDLQIIFSPLALEKTTGKNADGKGSVSIGLLKSNKGSQTYALPDDLDLSKHRSVLIHCVKYAKLWGGASL